MMQVRSVALLLASALLAACAVPRAIDATTTIPPDAVPVASVRPVASPQAATWLAVAELPAGALRARADRAVLLEVSREDGGAVGSVEPAPLELANLIVRVTRNAPRDVGIALESSLDASVKLDLFVSPDGERFRYISSCPVIAGGSAYEKLAEPVAWVAVARVRLADPGEPRCE